jgi:long-subunit fatty acid transport protein
VTENQLTFNEVFTHHQSRYEPNVKYGGSEVGFFNGEIYNRYEILTNPTLGGLIKLPVKGKDIAVGLSIFQPFDKNIAWKLFQPRNNNAALPGQQVEHNFDAVAINLVTALELMEDKLSLGISAGVLKSDLIYGGFFLRPNPADPGASYYESIVDVRTASITEWQHSDGYGISPNFRAGLFFKATPKLTFGLSYAMKTKVTIEGDSYFYYYMPEIFDYNHSSEVSSLPDSMNYILTSGARYKAASDFETEINLPSQLGIGIAYQVNDKLLLAGDLEYTTWSDFEGYKFNYSFPDTSITRNSTLNTWMVEDMSVPVDWKNSMKVSAGLEYAYSDLVRLRGGYSADQSPMGDKGVLHPAFFDPGLNHSINFGLGLVFESVNIDFATEYLTYPDTEESGNIELNGDSIIDNMAGAYGGSSFESVFQITFRF